MEKEADEARHRLSQLSAELESALQAYRNYQSELVKVKSLNEQLTEQIEIITRDKRRLQGEFSLFAAERCYDHDERDRSATKTEQRSLSS